MSAAHRLGPGSADGRLLLAQKLVGRDEKIEKAVGFHAWGQMSVIDERRPDRQGLFMNQTRHLFGNIIHHFVADFPLPFDFDNYQCALRLY